MTNTITITLTQADLHLLLMATTRLVTYCTAQRCRGNTYAGAHIPHLVDINHQIVTQLHILKRQAAYAEPNAEPEPTH